MTSPLLPNWRDTPPVNLVISNDYVPYDMAVRQMEDWVDDIIHDRGPERLWLLEHPPLYTAGTSAKSDDLRDPERFPVFSSRRGGQYTYHGPGQRVAYVMLDLRKRCQDIRLFVKDLEGWIITALDAFGVQGEIRENRVGVWVDRTQSGGEFREDKIAAIGVRLRKWVSFHGISLNVEPDLSHFEGITPCGIADPQFGVTSLVDLGRPVSLEEADNAMIAAFRTTFGGLSDPQYID